MTADDFEEYVRGLGLTAEVLSGDDGNNYSVVRDFELPSGALRGRRCDVAIQRVDAAPYVVPPAIHTRPHLVPMDGSEPLKTMESGIGPD